MFPGTARPQGELVDMVVGPSINNVRNLVSTTEIPTWLPRSDPCTREHGEISVAPRRSSLQPELMNMLIHSTEQDPRHLVARRDIRPWVASHVRSCNDGAEVVTYPLPTTLQPELVDVTIDCPITNTGDAAGGTE